MDVREILERLDKPRFFLGEGLQVKKQGPAEWVCKCPFCEDTLKDPHFNLDIHDGTWICFKCGAHGNAVSFYAKLHNVTNGQAVKAIREFAGIPDDPPAVPPKKHNQGQGKGSSAKGYKRHRAPVPVAPVPEPKGRAPKPEPGAGEVAAATDSDDDSGTVPPGDTDNAANIYQLLVDKLTLSEADRESLKTKRGFTDATIDEFMFRSGGQEVIAAINEVAATAGTPALVKAGILIEKNGTLIINDQLLDNGILIPYLDESDKIYHLRPHKLGFRVPVQSYCRKLLASRPRHIVITEGEFKAVALWQWGIPALAVPGVSSFAAKNLDRLINLLREFEVKTVTIIFDNEKKDDPNLPNYKPKVEDRFDTPFWAYIMADKLGRSGFTATVGQLPDAWRVNGKIDFDGALAAGRTKKEIQEIIDAAVPAKEFLDNLPDEARRIVRRKITRHYADVPIRREFHKYVAERNRGEGQGYDEPISNFVLNIKSSFFTTEGVIRNVELVNEYGETSETFALEPTSMAGVNEFKKFCFSKGNFIFKGRGDDLINIWEYEFLRDTGELIYQPERIGRLNKDLWLFGNMALKSGKIYRPDTDGIIWVDQKGYKPQSLQIGPRGEAIEDSIPSLSEEKINIQEVAGKLRDAIGGYEAYMALGWVVATIFSEDIFAVYKCMPILMAHGKRESGKSTFLRWIMSFFGVETEGTGIAETSQNYIARALSYFSSLGTWFDEYRNEAKIIAKDGFFRSAYNRQLSGKGTATAFQARGFSVHASIAISGEELPQDNGLFTRLVPLQLSAHKRNREHFEWLNRHSHGFSSFVRHLVLNHDHLRSQILGNIAELKTALLEHEISDRTAENWAICAGAFDAVILKDDKFIEWVEESCQEIKQTGEQEHMLNQFWEDLNFLFSEGEINKNQVRVIGDSLYIWFPSVFETWAIHYRKRTGREPFDRLSILKYLREEPYCGGLRQLKFAGANRKVHEIVLKLATDTIKELGEAVKTRQEISARNGEDD